MRIVEYGYWSARRIPGGKRFGMIPVLVGAAGGLDRSSLDAAAGERISVRHLGSFQKYAAAGIDEFCRTCENNPGRLGLASNDFGFGTVSQSCCDEPTGGWKHENADRSNHVAEVINHRRIRQPGRRSTQQGARENKKADRQNRTSVGPKPDSRFLGQCTTKRFRCERPLMNWAASRDGGP